MKENFWDQLLENDEHASTYMLTYNEGPGAPTRLILGEFVNINESVLDAGCGPGWNMEHFAEYGPQLSRYKGVDYSQRFVRVANQRRKDKYPTDYALPFEVQDCRKLQEPDKSWDVVIMQDCLEHTNGFEKPVLEALRVARKRVIVSFWHLTDSDSPHINDDGNDGWGAWYDKRDWEKFLNKLDHAWFEYEVDYPKDHLRRFYIIDKELE